VQLAEIHRVHKVAGGDALDNIEHIGVTVGGGLITIEVARKIGKRVALDLTETGNWAEVPSEIVAALVIITAESAQKLRHRILGGLPPVVDVFRGVLIFVPVADLAAELKDAKVGTDVVKGGIGTGGGEVHLRGFSFGNGDILETPIGSHLKRRIRPIAIVAKVGDIGVGLRRRVVTAAQ